MYLSPFEILRREFKDLEYYPLSDLGYTIELFDNDIFNWKLTLLGPKDTPYEDGIFFIKLKFPVNYPEGRPEIFFLTPIYHPNVLKSTGFVGVNFIYEWDSKTTVRQILTKLYVIFYEVNPYSPYSGDQANEYKTDRDLYELKVRYFTKKYASIKSYEDIKKYGGWDFSFKVGYLNQLFKKSNKNSEVNNNDGLINLHLSLNGTNICNFQSNLNERTEYVTHKYFETRNINPKNINLCVCEGRKLDMKLTLRENGVKDGSNIIIITDVHF